MLEQIAERGEGRAPPCASSTRNRLVLTGLALASIMGAFAWYLSASTTLAAPMRIHIEGLSSSALSPGKETVRVFAVGERDEPPYPEANRLWQTSYWFLDGFWVQRLFILLPSEELARITEVTVTVGDDVPVQATGDEARSWPKTATREIILVVPLASKGSSLPWMQARHVNWPSDSLYWRSVAQYSLAPVLLVLCISYWRGKTRGSKDGVMCGELLDAADALPNDSFGRIWNAAGLLFLVGSLAFLEIRDAYYFCQNDSIMESFPMILTGMRSFWNGEFPDYNPYLFLGSPLASLGMYALTYPPMHVSYAIARHLLRNEYATIEVFALLHLLVGFLATRALAHRAGMSALPANLVALSFVLSGASLIVGRSWFNFLPLTAWLPLTFLSLLRLRDGPATWKWMVGTGVVLGMPIHVGFAQTALYVIGFFCLGVLCLAFADKVSGRKAAAVLAALCVAAGIGAPLAYQQWLLAQESSRTLAPGDGIARGLAGMLLPYPLVEARLPVRFGNVNIPLLGQFYFFGGLLAWLFIFQLASLTCRRLSRTDWARQLWTVCALAALWLGLGDSLGLWTLVSKLPALGFLNRHPLRVMPFIVFFVSIAGGLALERLLRQRVVRGRTQVAVGGLALAMLGWHVYLCQTAFYVEGFTPYPALPQALAERFWTNGDVTGRVVCWGRHGSDQVDGGLLPGNLPTVYGLPQTGGLNPLLANNRFASGPSRRARESLAANRAYGNRWHLTEAPDRNVPIGSAYSWWYGQAGNLPERFARLAEHCKLITSPEGIDGVVAYELDGTAPLAFPCAGPVAAADESVHEYRALPVTFHGGGVDVDVSGMNTGQWITVNFHGYPRPLMRATLDGQELDLRRDFWERIAVQLPAPGNTLAIRYQPDWTTGMLLSLAAWFAPVLGACAWILKKTDAHLVAQQGAVEPDLAPRGRR